tara:strand:- start:51 stop:185 length:135 start_codon:yes stop_codon:yes gene_type:complete
MDAVTFDDDIGVDVSHHTVYKSEVIWCEREVIGGVEIGFYVCCI